MAIPFLPRRDDEDGPALDELDDESTSAANDGGLEGSTPTAQPQDARDDDGLLGDDQALREPPVLEHEEEGGSLFALGSEPDEPLPDADEADLAMERQVDMSISDGAIDVSSEPQDELVDQEAVPASAHHSSDAVSAHEPAPSAPEPAQPVEAERTEPVAPAATSEEPLEPVHAVGPTPEPPDEVVPPLGVDHAEPLLAERHRDQLRPGGGPEMARPARIIAMANQKGGVGKTTTTINLGAALAELGARVLLVDIDPQGSLGVGLGADPHSREATVYNLLLMDGTDIDEVIIETNVDNLHLLPANIDLAAAELLLVQEVAREQALRRVIERVQYRYDFVLIDCPPSLGLLTINGLTAADAVIVPLEAEYFALRGMTLLMQTLEKVQERLNPQLQLEGIVATMFDGRTLHAREVLERVRSAFGDTVFKTTINKTIRFAEAPVAGEPILTYRPRSKGSDAYRDLAREVLAREPSS